MWLLGVNDPPPQTPGSGNIQNSSKTLFWHFSSLATQGLDLPFYNTARATHYYLFELCCLAFVITDNISSSKSRITNLSHLCSTFRKKNGGCTCRSFPSEHFHWVMMYISILSWITSNCITSIKPNLSSKMQGKEPYIRSTATWFISLHYYCNLLRINLRVHAKGNIDCLLPALCLR